VRGGRIVRSGVVHGGETRKVESAFLLSNICGKILRLEGGSYQAGRSAQ